MRFKGVKSGESRRSCGGPLSVFAGQRLLHSASRPLAAECFCHPLSPMRCCRKERAQPTAESRPSRNRASLLRCTDASGRMRTECAAQFFPAGDHDLGQPARELRPRLSQASRRERVSGFDWNRCPGRASPGSSCGSASSPPAISASWKKLSNPSLTASRCSGFGPATGQLTTFGHLSILNPPATAP